MVYGLDYAKTFGLLMLAVLTFYVVLERFFPYRADWDMTMESFVQRDVKFLIVNTLVQESGRIAIGWFALKLALTSDGVLARWPAALSFLLLVVLFEFLQYIYHRLSHELKGRIGGFLWRIHAAHHLPDRLYVMIHAVGHPLDLLVTNVLMMLGLPYLLGASADVTLLFLVFVNAIGIVSHLNVDLRLGWLNYVFVGPEAHRFHHSADAREAKNFGAVLTCFDILFKTFVYRPGRDPKSVGVNDGLAYPDSTHVTDVLALPFRTQRDSTTG